jgi:hypothetical protein
MQHREDDVNAVEDLALTAFLQQHKAAACRVTGQCQSDTRRIHRRQLAIVDLQCLWVVGAEHPGALGADTDRNHVEALVVDVAEHATGRDAGDCVLGAATAEYDSHTDLGAGLRALGHGP